MSYTILRSTRHASHRFSWRDNRSEPDILSRTLQVSTMLRRGRFFRGPNAKIASVANKVSGVQIRICSAEFAADGPPRYNGGPMAIRAKARQPHVRRQTVEGARSGVNGRVNGGGAAHAASPGT